MKSLVFVIVCTMSWFTSLAQCNTAYPQDQSPKIASYNIEAYLDHDAKRATCQQTIRWKNTSPDTIRELRMYMYMNAFQGLHTTYLKGGDSNIFGQDLLQRTEKEWGFITINSMEDVNGNSLSQQYVQPNDQNPDDESVVEIALNQPIYPGETQTFTLDFVVKLPKTIVRSGFGKDDFFLFVHWFPQMGVYEQNKSGEWAWNCHQFMRGTEFFADFGDYTIKINASDHLVIGASGCRISEEKIDGRQIIEFQAHDLIDFGWVAYPTYDVYTSTFMDVDIEILMPPEHCAFADRYLKAVEHGLEYLGKNVGKYPYPKITVVDPPVHTLNSGFMEYPMMITGATFFGIPQSVRSVESLVIHEFTHMYFMATLASNEKEEAWLDEGFVTYYEDRILDHYYGDKKSLFNVLGFTSGNAENSRLEYTGLPDPSVGAIARPGWEFRGSYKGLIYAKTATVLKTLEGIVTRPVMDDIIQTYFEAYKFKHPKEADFRGIVDEVLKKYEVELPFDVSMYFDQCLHGTDICDFEVVSIKNNTLHVRQNGGLIVPVEIEIVFEGGKKEVVVWDGKGADKTYSFSEDTSIHSAHIDPEQKIYLDLNFINNSKTKHTNSKPLVKYAAKSQNWIQVLAQLASYLM
ncbi:MAG: M1 family metallopeptidase [Saprospiraceae bacterium]|nr:M1 family metallopeptidase [Saprospiraceae bacterium]